MIICILVVPVYDEVDEDRPELGELNSEKKLSESVVCLSGGPAQP